MCVACNTYTPPNIPPVMTLGKEDYYKSYKLSDLVESYRLIPLETNDSCLVGNAGKTIFDSTTFYIKDAVSKVIYHFDMQGKFLNSIGKRGRGPFEYLHLDDYVITNDKKILILDGSLKHIIIYNSDGKPIEHQQLPFFADAVEVLNDSILIFNGSSFEDQVIVWNYRTKRRINSFLKYDSRYSSQPLKSFTKYKDEILWCREFEQTLYKVTEHELTPARYIDFQENAYKGELNKLSKGIYFLAPNIADISRYYENDEYINFIFECEDLDELPFFVYYFKKSRRKIVLNSNYYTDDLTFYHIAPPTVTAYTVHNEPVCILYTSLWLNSLKNTGGDVASKAFEELKRNLNGVSETDNPILVIYKLKNI